MKETRIVIFDCDGVMFDTAGTNKTYYNRVLAHMGRPEMTDDDFAYVHAHTGDESIAYLFDDEESFMTAQAFRRTMNYMEFIPAMEMEPNLKPLIEELRPRFRTAIVTNRTDTMPAIMSQSNWKDILTWW